MRRVDTDIPGVSILEPQVFGDERGFFFESYHQGKLAALGIDSAFVQDNHSRSVQGTLRGLHYQLQRPQAKLIRVLQGEVLDVAVDIRHGSPTFAQSVAVRLSAENKRQLFVPHGFAHGFLVLSEFAEVLYKCDAFYDAQDEHGIIWNDPQVALPWGIETPLLSPKDQRQPTLATVDPDVLPHYSE
jgi:dTDP-4-dehydrorhamnose 3,5-epimerase